MPTVVQFRRGSTTQNNAFTGAEGEITIDTTLDTLRVHDGATGGGIAIARSADVTTANVGMIGYVDNSTTTANIGMKGYVDDEISNIPPGYANVQVATYLPTYNGTILTVTTANVGMIGYVDNSTTTANIGLKGYVDATLSPLASPTFTTAITTPVITKSGTNGVGDIGQTGNRFATIYGLATSAQYADLAEIYKSDVEYAPGTVVVFGGTEEITQSISSHDRKVAGVISTQPAHVMNATAEGQPIALQGRVPCKTLGPIEQGDMVVTSDSPGVAQKLNDEQYQTGCVLGKSLGTITDNSIQTIEVVVGRV